METLPEIFEPAERYSLPNPGECVKVKAQVMQRVKGASGHFSGHIEMPQIGPRKGPASVATARRIGGAIVLGVLGVLDVDGPLAREQLAVARIPGWEHAVEHVHAAGHGFHDIEGRADAH